MKTSEFIALFDQLTKSQLEGLCREIENKYGTGPYYDYNANKSTNIGYILGWVRRSQDILGRPSPLTFDQRLQIALTTAQQIAEGARTAKIEQSSAMRAKNEMVQRYLPEYKLVYDSFARGRTDYKPQKFIEAIQIRICPSTFTPSAQGDFAFTKAFIWDGRSLMEGPGFSYDTMISSGVNPYERTVDVPLGQRVWVATYDGQWGGYWSRVLVFIHPQQLPAGFCALPPGR